MSKNACHCIDFVIEPGYGFQIEPTFIEVMDFILFEIQNSIFLWNFIYFNLKNVCSSKSQLNEKNIFKTDRHREWTIWFLQKTSTHMDVLIQTYFKICLLLVNLIGH